VDRFRIVFANGHFVPGWNEIVIARTAMEVGGAANWADPIIRLGCLTTGLSGQITSVTFDSLRIDYVAKAKVIVGFDDGFASVSTKAAPILEGNGQRLVSFNVSSLIGEANRLTWAQAQALDAAGHDMANHTQNHLDLRNKTQAVILAEVSGCAAALIANGMPKAAWMLAYPQNYWDSGVLTVVQAVCPLARSGRTHYMQAQLETRNECVCLRSISIGASTSPATVQGYIDEAILENALLILTYHEIVDAGATGTQVNKADLQTVSDYLKVKSDATLLDVVTMSEYWQNSGLLIAGGTDISGVTVNTIIPIGV
jgi:hypothetical protein